MTLASDTAGAAVLTANEESVANPETRTAARDSAETMVQALRSRAARQPNASAFVFLDHHCNVVDQTTFPALDARARSVGSKLASRGLRGERVMLVFPSGLDFVAALFGCFYAGCVAVPAPYLVGSRAIDRCAAIFKDCKPAAVLAPSQLGSGAEIRRAMPSNFVEWIHVDAVDPPPQDWDPLPIGPMDLALLQYTSGSTSDPRGVMLSHDNLIANNIMLRDTFGHDENSRGVSWLPLFHDMGLIGHVLQPVYVGALSVLMSPLSFLKRPITWLKAISDWRATTSGGPSYGFELCARAAPSEHAEGMDLSTWNVAYCGSEMIRADTLHRFAQAFAGSGFQREALTPCYGLAEATLMVTASSRGSGIKEKSRFAPQPEDSSRAPPTVVSCGCPCSGQRIVIAHPQLGIPARDREVGEIWVKGPNVGLGYWGDEEQSKRTFAATINGADEHYLRTGDLGFIADGELFVTGRMKDAIIIRGTNHAPEDIEASVASSHQGYAAMAGAAFAVQTAQSEEVVVVHEIARSVKDRAGQNAAVEAAFERVVGDHGLRLLDFVLVRPGAVPRTSSGKVQRQRCREIYQMRKFERLNDPLDLPWLGINREIRGQLSGS
jgi:acyl-CoA synthetase (AMP-forming)/AMP-acid ligase II